MNNKKYSTKFSRLTLAVGEEPIQYLTRMKDRHPSEIYLQLKRISVENKLPMVSRRTINLWINRIQSEN